MLCRSVGQSVVVVVVAQGITGVNIERSLKASDEDQSTHHMGGATGSNDVDSLCVDVGKTIVSLNNDKVSRGERIRAFSPSLEREIILHEVLSRTGDL